jgi:hypothetical protein
MRALMITAAAAALLSTAGAHAQTVGATGVAGGSITQDALNIPVTPPTGYWVGGGEGGSVEAIVSIKPKTVSFESGVAVSGGFAESTSFSGVDITLHNNTDGLVQIDNFGSTIIPAGMGFYLQDRTGGAQGNNIFTGYGQTNSGLGFENLDPTVSDGPFAYSNFEFTVTSNDVTLYSLSGYASLTMDIYGNVERDFWLSDFEALDWVTAYDNPFAYAFAWDAEHIVLPLNALLEMGESQVIEYRTSVTSFTRADCINPTTCLVAYSGFGDPIGRGGGVAFAESIGDFQMASFGGDFGTFDIGENPITGIVFDPQEFTPFEFIPNGGTVPEPSTWTVLILGFGMLGAALRRRRILTYS